MFSELLTYFIFQPVIQGDVTGYQVYYNGTIISVTSSNTTTLIFIAPLLPDDVFNGTVVVMVTAVSRIGVGPASAPATAKITGKYVYICMYIVCNNLQCRYSYMYKTFHSIYSIVGM